jgi:hypothetical protein
VDADGILVDHPTRLRRRTRIRLARLAAVRIGSVDRNEAPHWPYHLRLLLRDGPPVYVPVPAREQGAVRDALVSAINEISPLRGDETASELTPPHREALEHVEAVIPPATLRFTFDAQLHRYRDGVRLVVSPESGWIVFHIVRGGLLIWLTCMLADYALGGRVPVTMSLQWTFVFAATMFAFYVLPTAVRNTRRGTAVLPITLDVTGNNVLTLSDPDFHGQRRSWPRDDIRSIEIGGWFWWITRVALLRVRLTDGNSVTLLYGHPISLLRPIASEVRRSLHLEHNN